MILEQVIVHDNEEVSTKEWHSIHAPNCACFRQRFGVERLISLSVAPEEVMFITNYRTDNTYDNVLRFKETLYDITRIDVYEGATVLYPTYKAVIISTFS